MAYDVKADDKYHGCYSSKRLALLAALTKSYSAGRGSNRFLSSGFLAPAPPYSSAYWAATQRYSPEGSWMCWAAEIAGQTAISD